MKLKLITIIHPSLHLIGGAERLMIDLALGLADEETRVEVVTGVCHSIWRKELLLKKNHVSLKELGKIAPGNLEFWLNVKGTAKGLAKLISPKTDLILASSFPSALAACFYTKQRNVNVLHYLHEAPMVLHDKEGLKVLPLRLRLVYRFVSWRYAGTDIEAVRKCDLIIANSLMSKKINANVYGIDESAIPVVYPSVNTKVVVLSTMVPKIISKYIDAGKPIIFIPKGAQFWRRPEVCLKACKALKIKDFVAVFTGGTNYEVNSLTKNAEAMGIAEKVLCPRELSDEEVNALYSHASVVISIPKRQPFGIIPLEALVCGAPSVIFDSSGVSEVLSNGVDIICVPDGDLQGLTNAIETLILNPELRKKIVSNGQKKVLEHFTTSCFVNEIKEKLQKLA